MRPVSGNAAVVALDGGRIDGADLCILHPALLDGCLQGLFDLLAAQADPDGDKRLYLPAQIIGPLAQLISMIVWTHVIDEPTLGIVTLVTATHELLQIAFLTGWSQYALRFLDRHQENGEAERFYRTENAVLLGSCFVQSTLAVAILLTMIEPAAGAQLIAARPTNNSVRDAVTAVLEQVSALPPDADGASLLAAAESAAIAQAELYRSRSRALAEHAAALLPGGSRLLTHCWMDTYLIELVKAADAAGKQYTYVATETRPYLQGARLTAHTLAEMGQDVTLITDGMAAAVLSPHSTLGRVDALVTAADRVSMDGHVFNKTGTLGAAVAAHAFGVPYYALIQAPDPQAPTAGDVVVEERDGTEVLYTLTGRTASPLVTRGHYPAFDVTPPRFVSLIVTDRGPFSPESVAAYHG